MNSKLMTIDVNDKIGFKQITKLERKGTNGKKSKNVHANVYEEWCWGEFKQFFKTEFKK